MRIKHEKHPFKISGSIKFSKSPKINHIIESLVNKILGLQRLDDMYQALPPTHTPIEFIDTALARLNIESNFIDEEISNIPKSGPVIIVANHPFGGIEGVIMAQMLLKLRPDVRIMANYFLTRFPDYGDLFIGVDPFGGKKSNANNMKPMREAVQWLRNGGVLLVFPAGEVAHKRWFSREIVDPKWNNGIARIAKMTKAPVTPVYISGTNTKLFHLLGLIHPLLRTAMLPREMLNKQNQTINFRIGKNIPYKKLTSCQNDDEVMQYLRVRTYMLQELQDVNSVSMVNPQQPLTTEHQEPVCDAIDADLLDVEVRAIDEKNLLAEVGPMQVIFARSREIPSVLQEIGRLRELTFRETGEGTGKSSDIDEFDDYYVHLFVWNNETKEVVGAYRLGLADEIVEQYGIQGLYTQTLFKYKPQLMEHLYPAIEVGRSFVRLEYQKSFTPLMLLWKGISQFVVKHPRYRFLFGPVSISNDYETISQQLLVDFLKYNNFHPQLARHVKARNPFRNFNKFTWKTDDFAVVNEIEQISDIVAQFEKDEKGMPILLKQYLKLGGTLLGFNVDNDFNNSLDGLIMVDLLKTDSKVQQKYMGAEQAKAYMAFHEEKIRQAS